MLEYRLNHQYLAFRVKQASKQKISSTHFVKSPCKGHWWTQESIKVNYFLGKLWGLMVGDLWRGRSWSQPFIIDNRAIFAMCTWLILQTHYFDKCFSMKLTPRLQSYCLMIISLHINRYTNPWTAIFLKFLYKHTHENKYFISKSLWRSRTIVVLIWTNHKACECYPCIYK